MGTILWSRRSPSCPIHRLLSLTTPSSGVRAATGEEQDEKEDHDDGEDCPSDPRVP